MSLPELAGGVLVASYRGTKSPVELVRRLDLGGVIVSGPNITTVAAQTRMNRELQQASHRAWPVTVAVDQEGGRVNRLGPPVTQFPSYMSLGAAGRVRLARAVANASGRELRAAGFTMVLAPVADVTIGPRDTAIASRSAGSDPAKVAELVVASARGYADAGVVPVVKHFPGHGSVTVDSHRGLPRQRHSLSWLERRDFEPFARAIEAGVPAVMVGHIALSAVDRGAPADLSAAAVDLLRTRMGFGGVVISDSLQMRAVTGRYGPERAAVVALRSGVDVVLMPVDPGKARRAIVRAVQEGRLTRDRLEQSVARLGALMLHQAEEPTRPVPRSAAYRKLAEEVSAAAVTVVAGRCKGPYVSGWVRPIGPKALVRDFTAAAQLGGLRVGHGPRLVLIDRDSRVRPAGIAVSVDTPYRMIAASRSPTQLALFGSDASSWHALVDVLQGRRRAPGHLPVGSTTPPACP